MGPYPTLRFGGACGLGVGTFYQEGREKYEFLKIIPLILYCPPHIISVVEPHRLNSVFAADLSRSLSPIFRNDSLGLLGRPGYPPVDHGFYGSCPDRVAL